MFDGVIPVDQTIALIFGMTRRQVIKLMWSLLVFDSFRCQY